MPAPSISLDEASKMIPNLSSNRIQQKLQAEALRRVQAEKQKIRAEKEEKEHAAVTKIEDDFHKNRNFLDTINEKFNEFAPEGVKENPQNPAVIEAKNLSNWVTQPGQPTLKYLSSRKIINAFKSTINAQEGRSLDDNKLVNQKIENFVGYVNYMLSQNIYNNAPIATLCKEIISNLKNNIRIVNFIRQLADFNKIYKDNIIIKFSSTITYDAKTNYINTIYKNINKYLLDILTNINAQLSKQTKNKYLKYKFKYLKLKNQMGGLMKS